LKWRNDKDASKILVIPKVGIAGISTAEAKHEHILGRLLLTAAEIARKEGFEKDGYRLVINEGKNGQQTVPWIHVHLIAGRQLTWPPG